MIRALVTAIKAIVVSMFIATVIVAVALLAVAVVVSYGCKVALMGSDKRGVGDLLLERTIGRTK